MSVLLCLLSALVEVHSKTVPYVSFMGTNLTNHSYVDLTLVGRVLKGNDSVQCDCTRAVVVMWVLTVETGTSLMEVD